MLILIAESKTMAPCDRIADAAALAAHRPAADAGAADIVASLRGLDAAALAAVVKISALMAARLARMLYDFADKRTGAAAIEAYTGVVFKVFAYPTLSAAARGRTDRQVRIISSLYGWLRPRDIIKPYRFDFTTPLAPGGKTFAAWWRQRVTGLLLEDLRAEGSGEVLNLLPADAARCIDWKRVAAEARVWRADFREVQPGGGLRTPNAGRLKTLRGNLLRHIVENGTADASGLAGITADDFMAEGIDDSGNILFVTA